MDDALPDEAQELISRLPQREDVVGLCRELDRLGAKDHVRVRQLDGVKIPFANPDLLWRMKSCSMHPKAPGDLPFSRELFAAEGRQPPQ